jgi:nucleotide-binding universal stress UspA family protein
MPDLKTILFATDFSENSNKALPYATTLARAFSAKLVLLHIEEPGESDPANPDHSFKALGDFDGEVEVERIMMRGHAPYKHILDLSRKKGCDLIVLATHGRSALAQFFLGGSTAEEVARYSGIPVFIVKVEQDDSPGTYTGRLKEILYTTDLSEAAKAAFPTAASFARQFNARLFVLHALEPDNRDYYAGLGLSGEDLATRVEDYLKNYVSALAGAEAVTSYHVTEGRAETAIVDFINANAVDLVAIATQGHAGLQEDLLGSTTDRVIRLAPCPVLAVRGFNS